MKARTRELLHATPFQPFAIRMADGKQCRIDHPDCVLAASSAAPQVIVQAPDGDVRFLSVPLMASVERLPEPSPSEAA